MSRDIDVYAVVKKLIGAIEPEGCSQTDSMRLENIKKMTVLIDELLHDLHQVRHYKDRRENSMMLIGRHADHFFKYVKTEYNESINQ